MKLRRGFKAEANGLALGIRTELRLDASAPLNPWLLAEYLDIPVLAMSSLSNEAEAAVNHFSHRSQSSFSGATVFDGLRRIIVYNDSHIPGRQANDLSHEISHALLLHQPGPALNDLGCRFWDGEVEEEASWLGGVLLVPEDVALSIIRSNSPIAQAAQEYGVTPTLMEYRVRMTGARTRIDRGERARPR